MFQSEGTSVPNLYIGILGFKKSSGDWEMGDKVVPWLVEGECEPYAY